MTPSAATAVLAILSVLALLLGTGQIYLTLIERFPTRWVYWHSRIRKPAMVGVAAAAVALVALSSVWTPWVPLFLAIQGLMLFMTYRMHQEIMFPAVDFPEITAELDELPVGPSEEVALIEVGEHARAYPLQYVIHHHVINDKIGDRTICLSYCAMCRTVIAFDVTDLGPLFVASYKNANMVVADRRTKTFFQQASFESIAGPLHPLELTPYPCQLLPWKEVLALSPRPEAAIVTARDFREFKLPLPIPGLWRRLMKTDKTPGLSAASKDQRFPARTSVIGFSDRGQDFVCLKRELEPQSVTVLSDQQLVLVSTGTTVNGFSDKVGQSQLALSLAPEGYLHDTETGTRWDLRGRYQTGPLQDNLQRRSVSDEYWFSWLQFHPDSTVLRLGPSTPPRD